METVGRIRHAHLAQKRSVREIARRVHVLRNTVRNVIDADGAEFIYTRVVLSKPRLGDHTTAFDGLA